ncbi:transporter substrate-binding domain-containing protein [Paraglaciecola sp. L3A3]|uniref:transporter substrate-binding domain-containing protein n=1 Tax=Paraglaciecola sp. L3A3 TaxID=2686358 RepID=UPI00131E4A4B|nr:transporter substrate-binding domain-containing protein [Paraglaciecola sp. L3A3]
MFKSLLILIFLQTTLLSFTAQGKKSEVVLNVGVPEFPPFAQVNEHGLLVGTVVNYFELLAEKTGIEFKLVPYPYARIVFGIKQGTLDLTLIYKNTQLEDYADFIGPISKAKVIVLPQLGKELSSYSQLHLLKQFAVIRSASLSKAFDRDFQLRKLEVRNYQQGIQLLSLNRVDALAGSLVAIEYNVAALGKNMNEFGRPFNLSEKEIWLHFSKKSAHRTLISKLRAEVKKQYKPDLMYQIYHQYQAKH